LPPRQQLMPPSLLPVLLSPMSLLLLSRCLSHYHTTTVVPFFLHITISAHSFSDDNQK
jgi:hypothetical protein